MIDEPLSPLLMQRSDSPRFSRRKDSRSPPPELFYPDELSRKDRAPGDYVDHMGRENRFREEDLRRQEDDLRRQEDDLRRREDDLRRQERGFDERDAIKSRGSSKGYYRDSRDEWR